MNQSEYKLKLHIEYEKPIEIINFSNGLSSFAKLYSIIMKGTKTNLNIEKVKDGSIDITFICEMMNNVLQYKDFFLFFFDNFSSIIDLLKSRDKKQINNSIVINDKIADNIKNIVLINLPSNNTVVNGNITLSIVDKNNEKDIKKEITIQNKDKKLIYDNCEEYLISKQYNNSIYEKQFFKWQRPDKTSYKNNLGLIENISQKPLQTVFNCDKEIKEKMIRGDIFDKEYLVDVEVIYKDKKPHCYNVIKLYE